MLHALNLPIFFINIVKNLSMLYSILSLGIYEYFKVNLVKFILRKVLFTAARKKIKKA